MEILRFLIEKTFIYRKQKLNFHGKSQFSSNDPQNRNRQETL